MSVALSGKQAYRSDIDGLRAVAVLAVVLYHAGMPGLPGGFAGVDIFFVISGYLIGGQVLAAHRDRSFSYLEFYARRARRIVPALLTVLAATMLAAMVLFTPEELRQLAKEAIASMLGASNVLFYFGNGYFAPAADLQPLLMTWSLGVEEQFYLIFPPVLALVLRLAGQRVHQVLLGASVVGFCCALAIFQHDPAAAFYLLPARAWELALGAGLAALPADRAARFDGRVGQALSLVAAALLVVALVGYRPQFGFPNWWAFLPVAATGLLLLVPTSAISTHLLSAAPLRLIGLISYSLYLWHWPIFHIGRVLERTSAIDRSLQLALACGLAYLGWRFVETPLRRRHLSARAALVRYCAVLALCLALASGAYLSGGLSGRLAQPFSTMAQEALQARRDRCLVGYGDASLVLDSHCMPEQGDPRPVFLLIGDSHASALAPALRERAAEKGMAFAQMTKSSCLPLYAIVSPMADRPDHAHECVAFQRAAFERIARMPQIAEIAIAGYWSDGSRNLLMNGQGPRVSLEEGLSRALGDLRRGGRRLQVVADVPVFPLDPYAEVVGRGLAARKVLAARNPNLSLHDGAAVSLSSLEADPTRPALARAARQAGAELHDARAAFCDRASCRFAAGDQLFFHDRQHLTASGARRVVQDW